MSMEACRCGKYIDTDEDDQAYLVTKNDGMQKSIDYALCEHCRDQFADLIDVKAKTDKYILDIFDHVRAVNRTDILSKLYEFRRDIEAKINPKER